MAHTNSKKAESLCKELTTSKFTGATDGDQLRAALQKPKEAAAAASATKGMKQFLRDHVISSWIM